MEETPVPERVLVVVAHPDDLDFGSAGTIAKWTRSGCQIAYVICTNGDKGTSDPEMTSERLAAIREVEQTAAAHVLGVEELVFLRYPDGGLEDTPEFRGKVVREIRRWRPEVVITTEPYPRRFSHRDHRIAGLVATDACFPYCRDRLHYPEHLAEGLMPHKVRSVLYTGADQDAEVVVDVTDTIDLKLQALLCHKSQIKDPQDLEKRIKEWAGRFQEPLGIKYGEGFRKVEFRM
ncbi:MAG: PIG-L family deacetylase [Chloroflexi bacterium]|nr:PIG-L family deacetylase [Chloroflexota bacterium]